MLDVDKQIKLLKDLAKSGNSQNSFAIKFANRISIQNQQIERFNNLLNKQENPDHFFKQLVEKIIVKYNSKEYISRFSNKSFEAPELLYYFLLKYSEKYGELANDDEFEKFGNDFMACLYKLYGFYFGLMIGQGSCVIVINNNK